MLEMPFYLIMTCVLVLLVALLVKDIRNFMAESRKIEELYKLREIHLLLQKQMQGLMEELVDQTGKLAKLI